jgi:hypothetical protein
VPGGAKSTTAAKFDGVRRHGVSQLPRASATALARGGARALFADRPLRDAPLMRV